MELIQVNTQVERDAFLALAQEYVDWMLAEIGRQYPELDSELFRDEHGYDDTQTKFSGNDRLFLAKDADGFCGCVALGMLTSEICEMRTMFVRPEQRGKGAGKALAQATMDEAREMGFQVMRLDTLDFMKSARLLYQGLGFYEIEAYIDLAESLKQYIHFLECKLT